MASNEARKAAVTHISMIYQKTGRRLWSKSKLEKAHAAYTKVCKAYDAENLAFSTLAQDAKTLDGAIWYWWVKGASFSTTIAISDRPKAFVENDKIVVGYDSSYEPITPVPPIHVITTKKEFLRVLDQIKAGKKGFWNFF